MTNEKMTIHKALSELKTLDSRIDKNIFNTVYVKSNKANNLKIYGKDIAEFEDNIISDFNSISDLIKRRNAIKKAVVLSNSKTIVNINGIDYSVAEAIEMKNHGIELKERLLSMISAQYNKAKLEIEDANGEKLLSKADKHCEAMYGTKESKVASEEIKKLKEDYIKANQLVLIDPLDCKKIINDLESEISNFKSEVDSVLSVSNALTIVEIEY